MPQLDMGVEKTWHFNVVARHKHTRRLYRTKKKVKATNYDDAVRKLHSEFNRNYDLSDIMLIRISGRN